MRPHRHLAILSLIASLGLAACGKPDSDSPADADQALAQQEESGDSSEPAEAAEPALPKVDYWKPIAAAIQGSHGANCVSGLERKPSTDTVTITGDGTVTIGSLSAKLSEGKTILMRTPAGKQAEGVSLIGEAGDLSITLNNFGPGNADHVTASHGDKNISCNNVKDVLPLDGRTLFTTFAQHFTVKPRTISCRVMPEMMSKKQVAFQLEGKQLKLGEQLFDLDKAVTESVHLDGGGAGYAIGAEPQRTAIVSFDQFGRLSDVTVNGFDNGPTYVCADLEGEEK